MDKNKKDFGDLKNFYEDHLKTMLLPFWMDRAIDYEYGGYYTCFDNSGEKLLSHDKYTWSQGRMVWVFSKLSTMECFAREEQVEFLKLANMGTKFLIENCLLENGNCTFLMERDGTPKRQAPNMDYDTSFYADCFVVLGLSKYARVSGDLSVLDFAKTLYESIKKRIDSGTFKSEPYPVPEGYRSHGIYMIMLNTTHELATALRELKDEKYEEIDGYAEGYMREIMDNFVSKDYVIQEMIRQDDAHIYDTLYGRYINPGHTLECMWFIMHYAMEKEYRDIIDIGIKVVESTFEKGWDREYGGILLFADRDGGKPKGSIEGIEDQAMCQKILNDWDNKLWWTHSEMLYTLLLSHKLSGDAKFLELYEQAHEYVFSTFPNSNREIGEWIQIRDRKGDPEQKVVALPVKDPFHIIRNVVLIIDLLGGECQDY